MDIQTLEKCCIINLDDPGDPIEAQYNPNKVSVGKTISWVTHPSSQGGADMLEFTNAKNRSLSVELFFDGLEGGRNKKGGTPVNVETEYVEPLLDLTIPTHAQQSDKANASAKRPAFVMIAWGRMRPYRGVIDSLNYDFSMFLPSGVPIRATVTLKVTEVDMLQMTGGHKSVYKRYDKTG